MPLLSEVLLLLVLVGCGYLLISNNRLQRDVRLLKDQYRDMQSLLGESADMSVGQEQSAPVPPETMEVRTSDTLARATTAIPEVASNRQETRQDGTPRAFVFHRELTASFVTWIRDNWVLAVAIASLAFAGLFMVQYGVEHGILSPPWRIAGALAFGAALMIAGEYLRRRFGDADDRARNYATEYLPSALAGAGLVVLFAAILSARVLYELIAPGTALAGLCLVSLAALFTGWIYGPVLAATGIIGGALAPFVVGGQSDAGWLFFYYYILIAIAGLAINTVKRWAWVSVVTLFATYGAVFVLQAGLGDSLSFLMSILVIAGASVVIPARGLKIEPGGMSVMASVFRKSAGFPEFPTRLIFASAVIASSAALWVAMEASNVSHASAGLLTLAILGLAGTIWFRKSVALADVALFPAAALLIFHLFAPYSGGAIFDHYMVSVGQAEDTSALFVLLFLIALAELGSLLAFARMMWTRSGSGGGFSRTAGFWALISAIYAPAILFLLEFNWVPADAVGAQLWAGIVVATGMLMAGLSVFSARLDTLPERRLCTAFFLVAALTLTSFSLFILLSKTALTLGLSVMVLLTGLLLRRFGFRMLEYFLHLGVAVIGYRLLLDPGLNWSAFGYYPAPLAWVLPAYLGPILLLLMTWGIVRRDFPRPAAILESAAASLFAVFLTVMVFRQLPPEEMLSHWSIGLLSGLWSVSALIQLYRLDLKDRVGTFVRGGMAMIFGICGASLFLAGLVEFNPLISRAEQVLGPPVLNSLAAAYWPMAIGLLVASRILPGALTGVRPAALGSAVFVITWYLALTIRHIWQGPDLVGGSVSDPELYSYTVAMLIGAVMVLIVAFRRHSVHLRKLAMIGVGLTVAKVFLIDMSGLTGLIRVFSFMGLGIALVCLAWINRKIDAQWAGAVQDS